MQDHVLETTPNPFMPSWLLIPKLPVSSPKAKMSTFAEFGVLPKSLSVAPPSWLNVTEWYPRAGVVSV
jgi:hypothetical protein